MPFFWKPYTSEMTDLITELRKAKPSLEEEQRRGRGLLWDKRQDRDLSQDFQTARVPQQPYVYQTSTGDS